MSSPIRDVFRIFIQARQLSDYRIQFQDELLSGIKGSRVTKKARRWGRRGSGTASPWTRIPGREVGTFVYVASTLGCGESLGTPFSAYVRIAFSKTGLP